MKKVKIIFMLSVLVGVFLFGFKYNVQAAKYNVKMKVYVGDIKEASVQNTSTGKKVKNVKWKSSNKKVASINKKGIITAKKKGVAIITGKEKTQTFKAKITVKKQTKKSINKNYKKLEDFLYNHDDFVTVTDNNSHFNALGYNDNGALNFSGIIFKEDEYQKLVQSQSCSVTFGKEHIWCVFTTDDFNNKWTDMFEAEINKATYRPNEKITYKYGGITSVENETCDKYLAKMLKQLNKYLINHAKVSLRGLGFKKYPI